MDFLFLLLAAFSLCWGLWLVRINRWPRVQVKVLKSWEEITGREHNFNTGWRHAELEYSVKGKQYTVPWREEISMRAYLPATCCMVLDPAHPERPQFPASWKMPGVLFALAALLILSVLGNLLK